MKAKCANRPDIQDSELIDLYCNKGLTLDVVGAMVGLSNQGVRGRLKRNGIQCRKQRHNGLSGKDNPNWNGGEVENKGRILLWIPPNHPMASMRRRWGYVLRSRLVMAEHLGRPLRREEIVHHKDENHRNDDLDNLELLGSCGDHTKLHMTVEHKAKMAIGRRLAYLKAHGLEAGK